MRETEWNFYNSLTSSLNAYQFIKIQLGDLERDIYRKTYTLVP